MAAVEDVDGTMCASIHLEYASTMMRSVLPNTGPHDQGEASSMASPATPRDGLVPLEVISVPTGTPGIL